MHNHVNLESDQICAGPLSNHAHPKYSAQNWTLSHHFIHSAFFFQWCTMSSHSLTFSIAHVPYSQLPFIFFLFSAPIQTGHLLNTPQTIHNFSIVFLQHYLSITSYPFHLPTSSILLPFCYPLSCFSGIPLQPAE